MYKSSKLLKLTLVAALAAGASLAFANPSTNVTPEFKAKAESNAREQIKNLNANYNGFESNKDYENFIQSRSKLLKRFSNNALRDVDVLGQPADPENVAFIKSFTIVPEDGFKPALVSQLEAYANTFAGNEFNGRRIAALKNNLTNMIIRAGYSTSVLYIDNTSFNTESKNLEFKLKWGKVGNVRVADDEHPEYFKNRAMLKTLNGFRNDILKIEGIDQLIEDATTPNKQVKIDVTATLNKTGYSDLVIHPYRTAKPHFSATFNNANSKGQVGMSLNASMGDLIGINDTWNLGYTTRLFKMAGDSYLDVVSLRYEQPLGWFKLYVNNSLTKFKNTVKGVQSTYKVYNPGFNTDWKLEYNLYRSKVSILNAYAGFAHNVGHQDVRLVDPNYPLVYQDNTTSTFKLGANYLNNDLAKGRFFADVTFQMNNGLFGGTKTADKVNPVEFGDYGKLISFYTNYSKNFAFLNRSWTSSTTLSGQLSLSNNLSGSLQTTYGDAYSVRGLREETFSGDSGFLATTTLGPVFSFENKYVSIVNPFVGLDFATTTTPKYKEIVEAESYHGASFAFGAKAQGSFWSSSLTVGVPFATSLAKSYKKPYPVQAYWNVSFNF